MGLMNSVVPGEFQKSSCFPVKKTNLGSSIETLMVNIMSEITHGSENKSRYGGIIA